MYKYKFCLHAPLALVLWGSWGAVGTAQGPPPAPVVVATVQQAKVRATVDVVGTIRPVNECTISSESAGLVRTLAVQRGDYVKAGQVVCTLKDTDLKLSLAEGLARLAALKHRLAELEAGTRKEDIARLRAMTTEAKAVKEKWDREKVRVGKLYNEQAASIKEYQDTISDWIAANQRLAQTQAALAKAIAGPRKQVIAQARARVHAQQAVVDQIKDRLDKTAIRAPYTGYITDKLTEVGQWVRIGGPVVDLLALDRVLARVDIPESAIRFAKRGDPAAVWIDALQQEFVGQVVHIIPRGDPAARTFPVEVEMANPKQHIKPGMFVRAKLPAGPVVQRLTVPKDAIVRDGRQRTVWVVRSSVAVPELVTTAIEQADRVAVSGNLKVGDHVVIRGNERLVPMPGGTPVTIQRSKSPPAATTKPSKPGT